MWLRQCNGFQFRRVNDHKGTIVLFGRKILLFTYLDLYKKIRFDQKIYVGNNVLKTQLQNCLDFFYLAETQNDKEDE